MARGYPNFRRNIHKVYYVCLIIGIRNHFFLIGELLTWASIKLFYI